MASASILSVLVLRTVDNLRNRNESLKIECKTSLIPYVYKTLENSINKCDIKIIRREFARSFHFSAGKCVSSEYQCIKSAIITSSTKT